MESLPCFPLFRDPVGTQSIVKSGASCGVCHRPRGWVHGWSHHSTKPETDAIQVCPWCIADGSAGALGITFNNAFVWRVALPPSEIMTVEDRVLVENCTPSFFTWQDPRWLACCGRACIYLGAASPEDLKGRWSEAVQSMFEEDQLSQEDQEHIVNNVDPEGSPCAYVFECQKCHRLRAFWDCH